MRIPSTALRLLFVCSLLWPSLGKAQDDKISIRFDTIPKEEIEQRLRAGEVENKLREPTLRALFEASGCAGEKLAEQAVKHVKAPNLICTLDGANDTIILVGGHFDFVNAGKGLLDNWSGSSLLPSLYQSLKGTSRHHTFRFVGFADEEKGLIGSHFYVRNLSKGEVTNVRAMINLDCIGASTTKMELVRSDRQLANALSVVAGNIQLPLGVVDVHAVGRSDSDSFQDRRIPSLNIHSLTTETFSILHTRRDTLNAVRMNDYYDSYLLIRAYLAYLDETLDAQEKADGAKR